MRLFFRIRRRSDRIGTRPADKGQKNDYGGDDQNPKGNRPRYPLVLVEVNRESGLVLRDSLHVLDDRQEGEHEMLTLSNFYARADRKTGELLVFLPRFFAKTFEGQERWTAPLMQLRVAVE